MTDIETVQRCTFYNWQRYINRFFLLSVIIERKMDRMASQVAKERKKEVRIYLLGIEKHISVVFPLYRVVAERIGYEYCSPVNRVFSIPITRAIVERARKEARSLPLKRNLNVICTSEAKQGKILGKHRRNSSRRVHLLRLRNILVRVSEYAATSSTNAYANRKVGTKKQGGTSAVREFQRLR